MEQRRGERAREVGSQILRGVYNVLFWVAFLIEIIISFNLRNRISSGVDLFPWGEGIGGDLMELLIRWVIMVVITALLYIFDSVGPCIFSKLTYVIMFIPPFLYPLIGGPGFFLEQFSQELYIKLFSFFVIAGYVFCIIDIVRWAIYMVRYNYKKREVLDAAQRAEEVKEGTEKTE